ncbi:MAG: hypothetical protein N3A66_01960, partial [Planctomycetota bacterium]|nr:hypothetical protein [Planctomycetota bacterium]
MPSQQEAAEGPMPAVPAAVSKWRAQILPVIWRFHPLIFLVLSFGLAGIAWPLLPRSTGREIAPAPLYTAGLAELRFLLSFDEAPNPEEMKQRATNAWVAFDLLIRCCGEELAAHPEFINPYLLRAEAARLLASVSPAKQKERLEQALINYEEARRWEERWRQRGIKAEDEALYALCNYVNDKYQPPSTEEAQRALLAERQQRDAEIAERRRRRLFYLRFQRSIIAAELGWSGQAEEGFLALQREVQTSVASGSLWLPREFEANAADVALISYHLARIYHNLGRLDEAQREWQRFLLTARRGEERFRALLSLGGIHLDLGRRALATPGEAADADARRHLQIAANLYSQVPAEGAPETLLREAYFLGGTAFLLLAEIAEEGRLTWWDTMAEARERWQAQIAALAGKTPPERMRQLPKALGALFWSEDTLLPQPASLWRLPAAVLLLGGESGTRHQQRRALISQARLFFEAASGGDKRLALASQMMVGRTLLAEGQRELARQIFRHTLAATQDPIVALACRHGEARSWLAEGRLDEAKVRFLGGVETRGAPELRPAEIDWLPLLLRIYEASAAAQPTPGRRVWDFLSADEREIIRRISMTRRAEASQRDILLQAFNGLLRRSDFYAQEYFGGLTPHPAVRLWLERDRALWQEAETMWLNRLLLEAAFSREIASAPPPIIHPPFPGAAEIGAALALSAEDIGRDLAALFRAYLRSADAAEREAQTNREQPRLFAQARRQQCRALDDALAVGYFLLEKYPPRSGAIAIEIGEASERLARALSVEPFFHRERSRSLIATAAATYLRASDDIRYEEESLLRAGYGFYAAGRLERCVEVLRRYLERYRASDRAGAAQNLLGRALWGLGQLEEAAKVYRDNADRRTPEGHKSLYYLGAVFLEMEQSSGEGGTTIDRIGDPAEPLPRMEEKGPRIQTALQAFEFLRRLPDLAPDSRPWRWATFGLGQVKQRIAERARRQAPQRHDQGECADPHRHRRPVRVASLPQHLSLIHISEPT